MPAFNLQKEAKVAVDKVNLVALVLVIGVLAISMFATFGMLPASQNEKQISISMTAYVVDSVERDIQMTAIVTDSPTK